MNHTFINTRKHAHYKYSVCLNISTMIHQLDLAHHLVFPHERSFRFLAGFEAWCPKRLPCSTQLGNSRQGMYLFFACLSFLSEGQPLRAWVVVWEVEGGVKRYTEMVCEARRTLCDLKNNHVYQCSPRTDQRHKETVTYTACTLHSEWEPH